uniref:Serine/threonine-protein phosphatase 2A activator n=1 Tax=Spongospora subterranea TaxID=70186 RepID=A0A0H5R8L3_9EUKA|eukprot:CRZ10141.1 hypothetical protein [Spongospora subterranea]
MVAGFLVPRKRIISSQHLDEFLSSQTYADFITYIERLNQSVIGLPIPPEHDQDKELSKAVHQLLSLLNTLLQWVDLIPAEDNAVSRFGNPAFREFYDRVASSLDLLLENFVSPPEAIPEVGRYLQECFGDRQRIDYGTGHEANFLAFLYCLDTLGVLTKGDDADVTLLVFVRYMKLMRALQFKYWLEPAGSHGVWGLDDYHFLPFLFGSSQLIGHRFLRPRAIRDKEIVSQMAPQYLYFACIDFINTVKTSVSLRWHSPMLDDISAVKTWDKVNSGMFKMYKAEVMAKLPIMQHFLFGRLIKFDGGAEHTSQDACCVSTQFPTCCGIPVPSAMSATSRNRPLPFD